MAAIKSIGSIVVKLGDPEFKEDIWFAGEVLVFVVEAPDIVELPLIPLAAAWLVASLARAFDSFVLARASPLLTLLEVLSSV